MVALHSTISWGDGPGDLDLDAQQCEHILRPMAIPPKRQGASKRSSVRYVQDLRSKPPTKALPALPVVARCGPPKSANRGVKSYRPLPPISTCDADAAPEEAQSSIQVATIQKYARPDTTALLGFASGKALAIPPSGVTPPPSPPPPPPRQTTPSRPPPPHIRPPPPSPTLSTDSGYGSQTVDQVISQLCQICHQDTALSTGFCWRCEHMWDSLLTGSSTFVPRPTKAPEPNVPPVASSSSSSSTARRHGRASSWTSCVSTVASQYNEDFDPGLPSPTLPDTQHYSAARPSLMVEPLRVNSPPSSGSETDDKPAHRPPSVGQEREGPRCAIRRGYAPGLLQQRSLARTPEAFDPELLAPAARSLLPSWLKRKPSLRRRSESRMYENMSYYFDDSNFKKPVDIKVVEMRSAPPPDAERSARFVASGSSGWI